jgi:O-antigen biosynthesis protein
MLIRLAWVLARKITRLLELWHTRGFAAVIETARERVHPTLPNSLSDWLNTYRPKPGQLDRFRNTAWPADAPTISVLVPVYNTREDWLTAALDSVLAQTYPRWQLVCVNDASTTPHIRPLLDRYAADSRVTVIHLDANRGVSGATNAALNAATGDYICLLDHDDALEPHALHRLAEAILSERRPGLLYSDEALTGGDINDVLAIRTRPTFSYDYYLCHPYFVHLVAVRTDLARQVGGLDEWMTTSHDVDFVLRVLELTDRVTHIPDVLYRWRTHTGSLGHQRKRAVTEATRDVLERHLKRTGRLVEVVPHPTQFNVFDVRFRVDSIAKVAILIPTKNQGDLLRGCVEGLERTVPTTLADIVVIDHQSDDAATLAYLDELRQRHRVVAATGPFNFSAIMNAGVQQVRGGYTHYLFLNNDTAAPEPGWLEHLLGFGSRSDVGCVGATLIYPDDTVQHAGVVVGLVGAADHAFRSWKFGKNHYEREPGDNCGLVCNRDYSAVTAACMLIRADVFDAVNGFDEQLAVGFNDTDLCLRVKAAGYKVIQDAHAVLFHYESQSRGIEDKHPADTSMFKQRYADLLAHGDPYFNPLLQPDPIMTALIPRHTCPDTVRFRTVTLR